MEGGMQTMSSIDNRVVTMKFDNEQFQNGVKQTIASLEILKEKLNIKDSSALEKINEKMPDLNPLISAAGEVANRFSILGSIAFGALERIGSIAVDVGMQMGKALTIQPILDGFAEYETEMNSIKTIQANLPGVSNASINKALAELNTYADKTVYSFGDMTRSIGLFTAAGVDLDRSVIAIKGMSNVAAGAGANNEALARANYQLSQALQSGTIRLMDWNSLVNAGMANPELQERLKQTAREMGKNVDAAIEKQGSFRDSLSEGWLTADVFLKTMALAADDTNEWGKRLTDAATKIYTFTQLVDTVKEAIGTGWGDSFRIIIGDAVQARDMFTQINNWLSPIISRSADARNKVLSEWARFGGRDDIVGTQQNKIGALYNVLESLSNIMSRIREGFHTAFPPMTGLQLAHITHRLREASEEFKKFTKINGANIRDTFAGIFSILHIGITIVQSLGHAFKVLISAILPSSGNFLAFTASLGRFFVALDKSTTKTELFKRTIVSFSDTVAERIKRIKSALGGFLTGALSNIPNPFKAMNITWSNDASKSISVLGAFKTAVSSIFNFIGKIFSDVGKSLDFGEVFKLINNAVGVVLAGGLFKAVTDFVSGLKNSLSSFNSIKDNIVGIFSGLRETLVTYQNQLKSKILRNIAVSVAILAGSLFLLASVDPERLMSAITAIAALAAILVTTFSVMDRLSKKKGNSQKSGGLFDTLMGAFGGGSSNAASQLIKIAVAVGILALALKAIADLEPDELIRGIGGLAAILAILVVATNEMSKNDRKLIKGAGSLIILGVAINILARAVKTLSGIDLEGLIQGIAGVGAILGMLAIFVNNIKSKKLLGTAVALGVVSTSILVLSRSVLFLGEMDTASLVQGLEGVGALLAMLLAFMQYVDPQHFILAAASLVIISGAITILSSSVQTLGSMDMTDLAKGLGGISAMLAGLVVVTRTIKPKSLILVSASLIIMAQAVSLLTESAVVLGSIKMEDLVKGLGAVGSLLAMLTIVTNLASKHVIRMLAFGVSLALISDSIVKLADAVAKLGGLSYQQLATGLIGLGAALAEIAIACRVMGPLSFLSAAGLYIAANALGAICDAMAKLGDMSVEDLIKSITALAAVLGVLALGALALEEVIPGILAIGLLGLALEPLANGLNSISGLDFMSVINGLLALAVAIGVFTAAAAAIELSGAGIPLAALAVTIALLGGGLWLTVEAFNMFSAMLGENSDDLAAQVETIKTNIETLTSAAGDIVINFLNQLAEDMPGIVAAGAAVVVAFLTGLSENIGDIIEAALVLLISFINGLSAAIDDHGEEVIAAAFKLIWSFICAVGRFIVSDVLPKGAEIVSSIAGGIGDNLGKVVNAGGDIINNVISGISNIIGDLWNKGCEIVNGIVDGIKDNFNKVKKAAEDLGSTVVNTVKGFFGIHSPSKLMHQLAGYCVDGFANGFKDNDNAADEAVSFAKNVRDAFNDNMWLDEAQPTISPVFDLSNIKKGVEDSNNLMNELQGSVASAEFIAKSGETYSSTPDEINELKNTVKDLVSNYDPNKNKNVNITNNLQVYRSDDDWYTASTIFARSIVTGIEGM